MIETETYSIYLRKAKKHYTVNVFPLYNSDKKAVIVHKEEDGHSTEIEWDEIKSELSGDVKPSSVGMWFEHFIKNDFHYWDQLLPSKDGYQRQRWNEDEIRNLYE